jgi:hypothetical protein
VVQDVLTPERLVMEHIMLVAILHANVGTEVNISHFYFIYFLVFICIDVVFLDLDLLIMKIDRDGMKLSFPLVLIPSFSKMFLCRCASDVFLLFF